jgi:hypothetical protein
MDFDQDSDGPAGAEASSNSGITAYFIDIKLFSTLVVKPVAFRSFIC